MKLINIPNALTFLRMALTLVILQLLFVRSWFDNEIVRIAVVVVIYIIAALTDYYDGYFARKYKERTEFGAFTDSLIDKVFTLSVFYAFAFIESILVMTFLIHIIAIREIMITFLRIYKLIKNSPMITERHGKIKTTLQIVAQSIVFAVMLTLTIIYEVTTFQEGMEGNPFIWDIPMIEFSRYFVDSLGVPQIWVIIFEGIPNFFLLIVAAFTLYSGVIYLYRNLSTDVKTT